MQLQRVVITTIMSALLLITVNSANAEQSKYYGQYFCNRAGFHCIVVRGGATWESLFNSYHDIDIVKRLNRMNTRLHPGMRIAVPNHVSHTNLNDINPLPRYIATREPTIVVNQTQLAWGAYNSSGEIVNWGPISAGQGYCRDIHSGCRTATGNFRVIRKQGAGCISTKFPVGKGGAKMPYCMFFHGGYALHGSYDVPGYNASHGCVRLFVEDAQWLNTEFVNVGNTKVIIQH